MQVFRLFGRVQMYLELALSAIFGKFFILFGTIEGPTVTIKCNKYFGAHLIIQILHIFT